jgi:Flp pilus assembly protein TadG
MVNRRLPGTMGCDRGAAVVEFALLLPLLLLLVFGIIDFGRALNAQITLTQAAREGARLDAVCNATVNPNCGTTVRNGTVTAATGLNLSPSIVSVTTCSQGAGQGVNATVTIKSYPFTFVTPIGAIAKLIGGSGFGSPQLSATGVMPCET